MRRSAFRHVRWSGAAYVEDARYARFRPGQGGELGVRLGLIPVRRRVEVVGAMVGVAVLDGYADRLLEGDRAFGVPAIETIAAADALGSTM